MKVRQRVLQIRRRVAIVAIAAFIALFSGIYVQMASGDDPALTTTTKATTSSSATPATETPAPVTTRQS
jgi:hypothetical protein